MAMEDISRGEQQTQTEPEQTQTEPEKIIPNMRKKFVQQSQAGSTAASYVPEARKPFIQQSQAATTSASYEPDPRKPYSNQRPLPSYSYEPEDADPGQMMVTPSSSSKSKGVIKGKKAAVMKQIVFKHLQDKDAELPDASADMAAKHQQVFVEAQLQLEHQIHQARQQNESQLAHMLLEEENAQSRIKKARDMHEQESRREAEIIKNHRAHLEAQAEAFEQAKAHAEHAFETARRQKARDVEDMQGRALALRAHAEELEKEREHVSRQSKKNDRDDFEPSKKARRGGGNSLALENAGASPPRAKPRNRAKT